MVLPLEKMAYVIMGIFIILQSNTITNQTEQGEKLRVVVGVF